jgi:hypothetical protein
MLFIPHSKSMETTREDLPLKSVRILVSQEAIPSRPSFGAFPLILSCVAFPQLSNATL